MTAGTAAAGPLAGLRVVELAAVGPGPFAAMMLADLGADVVRIDRPGGRQLGRPDASDPMLRGRRRVDANLKTEPGRETVFQLIRQADVLMEGYRPGVAERLGVGPAECLSVGAIEPQFYAELLRGLGLAAEDLPAQRDPSGYPVLAKRFEEVFATRTRDEWATVFAGLDACTTPVLSWPEAPRHPHLAERQTIVTANGTTQAAPAPRFSCTPAALPPPMADPVDADDVLRGWVRLPTARPAAGDPAS